MLTEDGHGGERLRDGRGRFLKGKSGNYGGRPPKKKPTPLTHLEALQRELAQEVTVNGPDGLQKLTKRDLLIASAVNDSLRANGKERWWILERLAKMGALDPTPEELNDNDEPLWCEAERQLIEGLAQQYGVKRRRWNIGRGRWEEE